MASIWAPVALKLAALSQRDCLRAIAPAATRGVPPELAP